MCSYVLIMDMYRKDEWGGLAAGSVVSLPLVVVPRSGYVQCYMNTCSSARKMDGKFELCYAF